MRKYIFCLTIIFIFLAACSSSRKNATGEKSSSPAYAANSKAKAFVRPLNIDRKEFVSYAKTFLGTPYLYGSVNAEKGLDCSGFIYNVFTHFKVKCPRSSKDYTNEGTPVSLKDALPGDIILFTGSNHSSGIVGHMGIVTENKNQLKFIHSATSKSVGVIISTYEGYYKQHFVKVIRVLQ